MKPRSLRIALLFLLLATVAFSGCIVRTGGGGGGGSFFGFLGSAVGGLLSLVIVVLDIYAILKIIGSGASTGAKAVWIVVILFFPVLGFIVWALAGPK